MVNQKRFWQKLKFDEICKNISIRIDNPKEANTDYYIGLEHLDKESPEISRHGSPQDVSKTKLKFKKGQILFARRNWYLRRLAVANREGICSAHMMVLEPIEDKIIKEFLPILMFSNDFFEKALTVSAGSMSPTIKWKDIAKLEFFIPSINEQQTLVSKICAMDSAISATKNLQEKTRIYKKSKTHELISKGLDHTKFRHEKIGKFPYEWKMFSLADLCTTVKDGPHLSPKYTKTGIPFLSVHNINKGFFDLTDVKYISRKDHLEYCKRAKPEKHDILYTKGGTTGIAKEIDVDYEFSIWVHLALLKLKKEIIFPTFLEYVLNSEICRIQARKYTDGMANQDLVLGRMKKILIPVPPISEQKQISSILSGIDDQGKRLENHLSKLRAMRKAILNKMLAPTQLEEQPIVQ